MKYLEKLFNKNIPNHLYHYTNGNSFLGIIMNQEMWASHIRFMNDMKEEIYAVEILEKRLPFLLKDTVLDSDKTIKKIKQYFEIENSRIGIFNLSFSENKDDLNQWRGYSNGIPSYCIEFNIEKMKKDCEFETNVKEVQLLIDSDWDLNDRKRKVFLLPCVYEENEQIKLIDEIVYSVLQNNYEITEDKIAQKIARTLVFYSPLIKHKMSLSENEWRIIILYEKSFEPNFLEDDLNRELNATSNESEVERLSYQLDCFEDNKTRLKEDKELLSFRMGKSFIVPYYIFKLKKDFFDGFVIGSCPDCNSVEESTIYFLSKNNFTFNEAKRMVTKTNNPYRNW